jgi:hypothetical protein
MMQLLDDGSVEVLLKDFEVNHKLLRQLISDLALRAQNSTTDTSRNQSSREDTVSVADALNFAMIASGWQVCNVCPGSIPPAKSTNPARPVSGPGNTTGTATGTAPTTNPSGDPGQSSNSLDTSTAATAVVNNTAIPGVTTPNVAGGVSPVTMAGSQFAGGSFGTETLGSGVGSGVSAADITGPGITADVPEPTAWVLAAAGLAFFGVARKRLWI